MVEELKIEYNYILNRYYNGCNYLESHPDEFDKYINKIMEFKDKLDDLIFKISNYENINEDEILGGFKVC